MKRILFHNLNGPNGKLVGFDLRLARNRGECGGSYHCFSLLLFLYRGFLPRIHCRFGFCGPSFFINDSIAAKDEAFSQL